MKNKKNIATFIGLLLLVILVLLGGIINTGEKLSSIGSIFGYIYYALIVGLIYMFIAKPLLDILFTKPISGEKPLDFRNMMPEEILAYIKSAKLTMEQRIEIENSNDIAGVLICIEEQKKLEVTSIIKTAAKQNFVITAISQNGTYDILSSLAINLKMINQIVKHYGYRPNNLQLIKLYISVLTSSLIITAVDDFLDGVDFNDVLGPLAIPAAGLVGKSVLNGGMNAYTCLRVGYTTVKYIEYGEDLFKADQSNIKPEVRKIARIEIISVVGAGVGEVKNRVAGMFNH